MPNANFFGTSRKKVQLQCWNKIDLRISHALPAFLPSVLIQCFIIFFAKIRGGPAPPGPFPRSATAVCGCITSIWTTSFTYDKSCIIFFTDCRNAKIKYFLQQPSPHTVLRVEGIRGNLEFWFLYSIGDTKQLDQEDAPCIQLICT